MSKQTLAVVTNITPLIRTIRGQKVILDSDLASIYCVPTKRLNEQVKRNAKRFPSDFLFQLSAEEAESLRSQFATLNRTGNRSQIATGSQKHRDPRLLPYAFTENGAIMAANVLNSPEAVRKAILFRRSGGCHGSRLGCKLFPFRNLVSLCGFKSPCRLLDMEISSRLYCSNCQHRVDCILGRMGCLETLSMSD